MNIESVVPQFDANPSAGSELRDAFVFSPVGRVDGQVLVSIVGQLEKMAVFHNALAESTAVEY